MKWYQIEYYISKLIKKIHFRAVKNSQLHKTVGVCAGTQIVDCTIDKYTDIGYDCVLINTSVGAFCSLGANIRIGGASHPMEWVSTSTVFCEEKDHIKKKFAKHPYTNSQKTYIKNDVWIGDGAYIKAGVTVANGAVIGMGSVVTKDVGAYEIWAGNPAQCIKKRFDDETIKILCRSKWWENSDCEIEKEAILFNDIKRFVEEEKLR